MYLSIYKWRKREKERERGGREKIKKFYFYNIQFSTYYYIHYTRIHTTINSYTRSQLRSINHFKSGTTFSPFDISP